MSSTEFASPLPNLRGQTVFICGDSVQADMLQTVADGLRTAGVRVVRGPVNSSGKIRKYSDEECAEYLSDANVGAFTIRHEVSRSLLERAPKMQAVCFPTIGVESLDLAAASERGVLIAHGATQGNVIGMAEATILLMLALLYKLRDSEERMKDNIGKPAYPFARSLQGKTIGLIGFGRIARAMAERLSAFGTPMLACSPRLQADTLPAGVVKVDLDTLLHASDMVCVLVNITPETRGMLGRRELALMKPSAYLINTSRGEAIDERALCDVLAAGAIAGAALDTFEREPLPLSSPLRALDNVILTPHMVGQTREARDEFAPVMVENILRMLAGRLPVHCKNPAIAERWLAVQGQATANLS